MHTVCSVFLGGAVCLEASLWGWSCVFLPVPPRLPQAAVCGLTGGSPAVSQPREYTTYQTSNILSVLFAHFVALRCVMSVSLVSGQRRGPVVAPQRRPVLLVTKRLRWSRDHRLGGREHLLPQQHGEAGEKHPPCTVL